MSTQTLRRELQTKYVVTLADVVKLKPLTAPFNSARPTLAPWNQEVEQVRPNQELDAALKPRADAAPKAPQAATVEPKTVIPRVRPGQ